MYRKQPYITHIGGLFALLFLPKSWEYKPRMCINIRTTHSHVDTI